MLKLRKIAVTGNLAAGKSTVCRLLKELGAYILNSDEIGHLLLLTPTLKKAIVKLLGNTVFVKGEIDRKKVASIVFNNQKKLRQLEKLLHPKILKRINKVYCKIKKENKYRLFVVEMPLLFETGTEKFFYSVICVTAYKAICQKRFGKDFKKRNKKQLSILQKTKKSDFIIENNQDLKKLKKQVINLYKALNQEESNE